MFGGFLKILQDVAANSAADTNSNNRRIENLEHKMNNRPTSSKSKRETNMNQKTGVNVNIVVNATPQGNQRYGNSQRPAAVKGPQQQQQRQYRKPLNQGAKSFNQNKEAKPVNQNQGARPFNTNSKPNQNFQQQAAKPHYNGGNQNGTSGSGGNKKIVIIKKTTIIKKSN